MRVFVATEARFTQLSDGSVWTTSSADYRFWLRYLAVFDEVVVLARIKPGTVPPEGARRADGSGVFFSALPYYVGPAGYLKQRSLYLRTVRHAANLDGAVILRAPGRASTVFRSAIGPNRPYGVEVVSDPYEVASKGAMQHPLRRFFRWSATRNLTRLIAGSSAVSYVTESALQRRYPPPYGAFVTHYSSIDLPPGRFVGGRRKARSVEVGSILSVGSLEQAYKGMDTLIEAIAILRRRGTPVTLAIVGDGRFRASLQRQAESLGLGDYVRFLGQLPGSEVVQERMDEADLFVLASRTEGLPRSMIEAMARGVPCIGTDVGGIPELLGPECLVPPENAEALSSAIDRVLSDPELLARMSERNLSKAGEYRSDVLQARRAVFYSYLRDATLAL